MKSGKTVSSFAQISKYILIFLAEIDRIHSVGDRYPFFAGIIPETGHYPLLSQTYAQIVGGVYIVRIFFQNGHTDILSDVVVPAFLVGYAQLNQSLYQISVVDREGSVQPLGHVYGQLGIGDIAVQLGVDGYVVGMKPCELNQQVQETELRFPQPVQMPQSGAQLYVGFQPYMGLPESQAVVCTALDGSPDFGEFVQCP